MIKIEVSIGGFVKSSFEIESGSPEMPNLIHEYCRLISDHFSFRKQLEQVGTAAKWEPIQK